MSSYGYAIPTRSARCHFRRPECVRRYTNAVNFLLVILFIQSPFVQSQSSETTDSTQEETTIKRLDESCRSDSECMNITHAECQPNLRKCKCTAAYPVPEGDLKCLKASGVRENCTLDVQCLHQVKNTRCENSICVCNSPRYQEKTNPDDGSISCPQAFSKKATETNVDYAMLGILAGMAVMFIIMCVVLRMFSKARFEERDTIFTSPRLLKISLASKKQQRQQSVADRERRGSRPGSQTPSRQPSVYSGLNVAGKSPTGSRAGSIRRQATMNAQSSSRRNSVNQPASPAGGKSPPRSPDHVTVDVRGGSNAKPNVAKPEEV